MSKKKKKSRNIEQAEKSAQTGEDKKAATPGTVKKEGGSNNIIIIIAAVVAAGSIIYFVKGKDKNTYTNSPLATNVQYSNQSNTDRNNVVDKQVSRNAGTQDYQNINPQIAYDMLKSNKDTILVDIRTQGEISRGTIDGAIFISTGSIIKGNHNLPRDKNIILFCAVGGRSWVASKALVYKGYKKVYNMNGGISAWQRAGLPIKR